MQSTNQTGGNQTGGNQTTGGEGGQTAIKPMFDDAQMRKLRLAVIGMGVVLLLGFATVIGRIVYMFNRAPVDPAITAMAHPGGLNSGSSGPDIRLPLPAGAIVRNLSLAGNRLAVHFDAPTGAGIAIIDLATGKAAQKIEIVTAR